MNYKHLSKEQRYAIYLGLQRGDSLRKIATDIGVSPSTVSREVQRNLSPLGIYDWDKAHNTYLDRRSRLPGNRSKNRPKN